jgi:response regulator RpfG family c-di-GMP phosphodiesterase
MNAKLLKAADRLLQAKLLPQLHYDNVKRIVEGTQERSEEVLISNSVMDEADLLKAMASIYRTKFASTERLSKADVPLATIELIPHKVAETFQIFPVLFDQKTTVLSVVTADPDEKDLIKEVQLVAGASSVQAFFARPAAIRALIQKHHQGEVRAFEVFERAKATAHGGADRMLQGDGRAIPKGPINLGIGFDVPAPRAPGRGLPPQGSGPFGNPHLPTSAQTASKAQPATSKGLVLELEPPPNPAARPTGLAQTTQAAVKPATPPPAASLPPHRERLPSVNVTTEGGGESVFELANVLINVLESTRPELRGHSSGVARLIRRICERIGLDQETTQAYALAGLFHDLGKMSQYHLTALNVAEYEGHRIAAEKLIETPNRLLESARLPTASRDAISQMYERWGGSGMPTSLAGKDISLGARILAVCDVYMDLTQNPRNPKRKQLDSNEACEVLDQAKGRIFDPSIVDVLRTLVSGNDVRARLLANRRKTLLLDPDPEESLVMELKLIDAGFEVKVARTLAVGKRAIESETFDLVVSDLTFPDGSGLAFLDEARKAPWGKDLPWVILAVSKNRGEAQKAFDLGVLDFISKPAQSDVVLAKLRSLLDNRSKGSRGVAGSLSEMSLGEVLQILTHGRKSGRLEIRTRVELGELFFLEGEIMHAKFRGQSGAEAFFRLMTLREGDFSFDAAVGLSEAPTIHEPSESLLLEALRRIDEGITR